MTSPSACSNGGITSRMSAHVSTPPAPSASIDRSASIRPSAFRSAVNGQWWSPSASDCWSWTTGAARPSARNQA